MTIPHQNGGADVAQTKGTSSLQSWWNWLLSFFFPSPKPAAMTDFQTWKVTEPWLDTHCALGEGPFYEAATNTLRFVDIINKRLHTVSLTEGPSSLKTLQLDMPVGVTADIEGIDPAKKILVGGKRGIYILERETGKYELLKRFYESEEKDDRLRSNDGAVDPQGRFWIATMNDFHVGEPQAEGTLFRFNTDLTRHTLQTSLTIPNSIGWSPNHHTQYFVHSTEKKIFSYTYVPSTGTLSNKQTFFTYPGAGDPDGFAIDKNGDIWQAIYGDSKIIKIRNVGGKGVVVGEVTFPTRAITCAVFVGRELVVTSAGGGEGGADQFAGGVFRVDVGVEGVVPFKFKLEREGK